MSLKYVFVLVGLLLLVSPMYSQVPTEAEARKELQKAGIDEQEMRKRLLERGIDLDNIDTQNPTEVLKAKNAVEAVMAELEAEKNTNSTGNSAVKDSKTNNLQEKAAPKNIDPNKEEIILADEDEIKDAVKDGATLDEAISEEIQQNVKEKLPEAQIYGHHLFRGNSVKYYRKSEDAKPPSSYIIGPGDQISVAIWGQSELNFSQELGSDGYIKPDGISRIYLSGLTIAEARNAIKSKFSRNYRFTDNTFQVNVITARTINVNITGEVFNVGSYSISALNNAFNALVAAGGPTDIGSVRNIKIAGSSGTRTLDIYKFQSDPTSIGDLYLSENDYIIVPVAEKVVEIKGAVNRPYKYELLKNEELNELIKFAGGLKSNAIKRTVKVTRIDNDELIVLDVNLNEIRNRNFELRNGDEIEVQYIAETIENVVTIGGAVDLPGTFAFKENMTVRDLLTISQPRDDAILGTAYLARLSDDNTSVTYEILDLQDVLNNSASASNITLQRGDAITIRSKSSFAEERFIEVAGAVRIEGTYKYNDDQLKVSDAIFLSGGLTDRATDFAFILRDKDGKDNAEYIIVDLSKALAGEPTENIALKAGDFLQVYTKDRYDNPSTVSISGAVRVPTELNYDSSLNITKALLLAGGLTFDASPSNIDIFRINIADDRETKTLVANVQVDENYNVLQGDGNFQLEPFDQIIVRKVPEFELQRNLTVNGEVKFPGKYALVSDNTKLTEIIKLAGGTTEEAFLGGATLLRAQDDVGYVIVDLEKAMKRPKSSFNAILQEGDIITIPKRNELVTVTGAVLATEAFTNEIAASGKFSFVFEEGKNAKYYVDKYAGGVSDAGQASKISVTYPNGEVKNTKKFLFWNNYPTVEPGSLIKVGYKKIEEKGPESEKEDIDWGKVLSDSVAQATTILTLVILINNLD